MSAQQAQPQTKTVVAQPRKITLEDVRRKAEAVQETARDEVQHVVESEGTRILVIAAVGVAVLVGLAYYMGSRAAGRPLPAPPASPAK
jgi:hypothetical protein